MINGGVLPAWITFIAPILLTMPALLNTIMLVRRRESISGLY
ncbi:MAG: hypothetical protein QXF45_05050 [Candidatus Caldarchaeum sp.]